MKKCSKCREELPFLLFSRDDSREDGLTPVCKSCTSSYHKDYYVKNREKILERMRNLYEKDPDKKLERARKSYENNKEKRTEQIKEWQAKNKGRRRWYGLKAKYGITKQEYEELLDLQTGVCAICKNKNRNEQPLHIDHSHSTGEVRGLLCFSCNTLLGLAKEQPSLLREAANYLEKKE